ncbi:hypothetical protein [Streptomyces lancefieldiae]|uniref:Transposase n=1 Tax=Streptomyces lancefieldiae TaxID=3075520 RepID=A0ABU3AZQ1_9ACTN|nr:hypothetical protein [Streptomyces sp. DSM 40712]MDT0615667.1 hypothetical protein [Streptomyces sp. DSM 40712]
MNPAAGNRPAGRDAGRRPPTSPDGRGRSKSDDGAGNTTRTEYDNRDRKVTEANGKITRNLETWPAT